MAMYYAYGDALVSKDELDEQAAHGKLQKFHAEVLANTKGAKIQFLYGLANTENILRATTDHLGANIGFEPIGLGKPLTVQIRHVYTGRKAEGFFGKKDMLVASAMKSIASYDAAPRAINFLVENSKNHQNFRTVDATNKGTPLICYSPALAQSSSVVTVEVMFANFPKESFDAVSQALTAAGGIPVFGAASGYLLAAGIVTKLVGNLGKALLEGTPALKRTEEITFITPGSRMAVSHFALMISDDIAPAVLENYKISVKGALVHRDDENRLYDGEHPYVVISLDGRGNDDLKGFTATAASAAHLDRFYNIGEGNAHPLGTLVDAVQLYNDMKYREKAEDLAKKLDGVQEGSEEYTELVTRYKAYTDNIGTDVLRPKPLT